MDFEQEIHHDRRRNDIIMMEKIDTLSNALAEHRIEDATKLQQLLDYATHSNLDREQLWESVSGIKEKVSRLQEDLAAQVHKVNKWMWVMLGAVTVLAFLDVPQRLAELLFGK